MDFALFDRSALGRCCLGLLLMICPAFCLPVMSAGDALTLQLKQEDRLPQTVTSIKQLNTRVGDILSLSSEFGESFEFRVETSRRSNHGNKVIRGVSEAGGRLTMVVTSDGQLQGSLREGGNTYRLVQEGGDIVKLIESVHLLWDDGYDGAYAEVRAASSAQGAAQGHTTRMVKAGEPLTVNFVAASGFALSSVESSCGGSLQGNAFTVDQVTSDCLLEPLFEPVLAGGDTFRLSLEEPVAGSVYSGVGNLRGWSVATVGIDRIEIWFDGVYAFDAPYGGARGDVGNIFPDIDNSSQSGFSLAWNYSNMAPGEHVITARAYNQNGQFTESSSTFTVTRFHKPFLGAGDQVDLSEAQCSVSDSQISLGDAVMDGKVYDILLDWRTAAQDFQIIEIR